MVEKKSNGLSPDAQSHGGGPPSFLTHPQTDDRAASTDRDARGSPCSDHAHLGQAIKLPSDEEIQAIIDRGRAAIAGRDLTKEFHARRRLNRRRLKAKLGRQEFTRRYRHGDIIGLGDWTDVDFEGF